MIKYTEEQLLHLKTIKEYVHTYNKIPRVKDITSSWAIIKAFGTWNKAIEAAGYTACKTSYTEEEILVLLVSFHRENNRIPTQGDFTNKKHLYPSARTVCNKFGTWNKALEKAGLIVSNNIKRSDEELLTFLCKFYETYSRVPTAKDLSVLKDYPGATTIIRRFGSWNTALLLAGLTPNIKTAFGCDTIGLDKHLYRSAAEAFFVDNYLFNKYEYLIEPNYPSPYHRKKYDWYIPSIDLYVELDGGCRPEVLPNKIAINNKLGRQCLYIPTKDIYNKTDLKDFIKWQK